jgi:hypothetical protein
MDNFLNAADSIPKSPVSSSKSPQRGDLRAERISNAQYMGGFVGANLCVRPWEAKGRHAGLPLQCLRQHNQISIPLSSPFRG